jgi:membrane protein required for colicin V production
VTAVDYAALGIAGLSVLVSFFRGAVREVMALSSWIGAFLIARYFAPMCSSLLPASLSHPWLRLAVAFAGLMLVSLVLFALVTVALTRIVRRSKLNPWDRALGVLFGLARAVVILVALVLAAGLTPLPRDPAWRSALFAPSLVALAKKARAYLPEALAERIRFE